MKISSQRYQPLQTQQKQFEWNDDSLQEVLIGKPITEESHIMIFAL